jgi:hypothetical protein
VVRARVSVGSASFPLDECRPFTFGRSSANTVCLNSDDLGLSRQAGRITFEDGLWWLVNRSNKNPLVHYAGGIREVVRPGRRRVLDGPATVWVDGTRKRYYLDVDIPEVAVMEAGGVGGRPEEGEPTAMGTRLFEHERRELRVLLEPYFDPHPREDPRPRDYAAAARRLDLRETTLRRRIDHLRERLTRAGVPNLTGQEALVNLAQYVLTRGLLDPPDGRPEEPGERAGPPR